MLSKGSKEISGTTHNHPQRACFTPYEYGAAGLRLFLAAAVRLAQRPGICVVDGKRIVAQVWDDGIGEARHAVFHTLPRPIEGAEIVTLQPRQPKPVLIASVIHVTHIKMDIRPPRLPSPAEPDAGGLFRCVKAITEKILAVDGAGQADTDFEFINPRLAFQAQVPGPEGCRVRAQRLCNRDRLPVTPAFIRRYRAKRGGGGPRGETEGPSSLAACHSAPRGAHGPVAPQRRR